MRRIIIGILLGFAICTICVVILKATSSFESISYDLASITIINESGRNVKSVILIKTGQESFEAKNIQNSEEVRFIWSHGRGEGVYNIKVTFDNDSTISSKGVYFKYGLRNTEIITANKITTQGNW